MTNTRTRTTGVGGRRETSSAADASAAGQIPMA